MQYWLVMPAAGAGRRFGGAKQYAPLAGRSVLDCALQPFLTDSQCAGGALVLSADDPQRTALQLQLRDRLQLVDGGTERVHSVCLGLQALATRARERDWVLVHDAARPTLSDADLARLCAVASDDIEGALLAQPVADTVKRATAGVPVCIADTLPRDGLWLAQTPQMFRYAALRAALEAAIAARRTPTDEAQAMEWQGVRALLVASADSNIKVTNAADLQLAEAILQARARRIA